MQSTSLHPNSKRSTLILSKEKASKQDEHDEFSTNNSIQFNSIQFNSIQFNSMYLYAKLNSPEANYKASTGKKMGRVRSKKVNENSNIVIKVIKLHKRSRVSRAGLDIMGRKIMPCPWRQLKTSGLQPRYAYSMGYAKSSCSKTKHRDNLNLEPALILQLKKFLL
jgi:hypothetical protein